MSNPGAALLHRPDDEEYWARIRALFDPKYKYVQLVNGRRAPVPRPVLDRVLELTETALSYELDEYPPFDRMKESGSSQELRTLLADILGCGDDEIALTRNTMEGLAIVLLGLDLQAGDEVLASRYEYDSALAIVRQRERRDGIRLTFAEFPYDPCSDEEIVAAFAAAITPRTRLILLSHVFSHSGRVLPIAAIAALARARGVFLLVDGAHGVGQVDTRLDALGCDAYAAPLHKWFFGPRGTGFLHLRREVIARVWPIWASWSGQPDDSIEKFEETGTVFKAIIAAIPEAVAFNREVGGAEKAARLLYLRNRWLLPLSRHPRIVPYVDPHAPGGCGHGGFRVEGGDHPAIARRLREEHGIGVFAFVKDEAPQYSGIHLSPSLTNTIEEIDMFVEAMHGML